MYPYLKEIRCTNTSSDLLPVVESLVRDINNIPHEERHEIESALLEAEFRLSAENDTKEFKKIHKFIDYISNFFKVTQCRVKKYFGNNNNDLNMILN